jgi:hypothetical protein
MLGKICGEQGSKVFEQHEIFLDLREDDNLG